MHTVWWWLTLGLSLVVVITEYAWLHWQQRALHYSRNYFTNRAWPEFVAQTAPRQPHESLWLLLANSQGAGTEVQLNETYFEQLQQTRKSKHNAERMANWSVSGGLFYDQLLLSAAAAQRHPTGVIVILSPNTFVTTDTNTPVRSRWSSDLFYLLIDPEIRKVIPPSLRVQLTDFSMKCDMAIGAYWTAWRMRHALSDRLTRLISDRRGSPTSSPTHSFLPYPIPQPPFDAAKAAAYLEILRSSASQVVLVNMPLHASWRHHEIDKWRQLETLCQTMGITTLDFSAAIPDDEFVTPTHLSVAGHRRMATRLNEALP